MSDTFSSSSVVPDLSGGKPWTSDAPVRSTQVALPPGMVHFGIGQPDFNLLPLDLMRRAAEHRLAQGNPYLLNYGAEQGDGYFRLALASFLSAHYGQAVDAERLLVTGGASQALDLICTLFARNGDVIFAEEPSYFLALRIFADHGLRVVSLPTDHEGLVIDALEEALTQHQPAFLYTIPTFQNPTGRTLARDRREKLARLAARYGVVLIEDDPYRDVRFSGEPLPAIKSFDSEGWVVYLGSFSKTIAPGLRVGYAAVDNEALLKKMIIGKQATDVHSPLINQAIVDAYLRSGRMDGHLARISADYGARLRVMLERLDELPPSVAHTQPEGGLFVWAAGVDTRTAGSAIRFPARRELLQPGRDASRHAPELCVPRHPRAGTWRPAFAPGARRLSQPQIARRL